MCSKKKREYPLGIYVGFNGFILVSHRDQTCRIVVDGSRATEMMNEILRIVEMDQEKCQ